MALESGTRSRYEVKYDFVWCGRCWRVVVRGNRARYVAKLIYGVAERYGLTIVELAVMPPDHVHNFVSASRELAPAEGIQKAKGITARKLF